MKRFLTSESVTEGHPDKLCDQISDAVLDDLLRQDANSRVACETCAATGLVFVMGEVTTNAYVDVEGIARRVIRNVGYNAEMGFDPDTCCVITTLHGQSPDIAQGVNNAFETRGDASASILEIGAGDQGTMFGYACDETPELMPMPIQYSHQLARRLAEVRKNGALPWLRPDGKTLVTIEYDDGKPVRVDTIVISAQHNPNIDQATIERELRKHVIGQAIPQNFIDDKTKYFINPTGRFVIGGPMGDSGLTGRKIIVDTYGGCAKHGGGAFSGKDPTKVDRSAAYAARYIAKNTVFSGQASKCEVQLAYAIGVAKPVSVLIDTFGTGKTADDALAKKWSGLIDLRPRAIIERFNLRRPIYLPTATYGHFGRNDIDAPWELTDAGI